MKVVVVGSGYVGLPAAIMLARAGHEVTCFDVDEARVAEIQSGIMRHVDEQELQDLMSQPDVKRNLRAQTRAEPADAFIIAVPTPLDPRKKIADLSAVIAAAHSIGPHLRPGSMVILESTVPPLTTRQTLVPVLQTYADGFIESIDVAHCPERILPGKVFHEIVHNDRIIGGVTPRAADRAAELYGTFVKGRICKTDDTTAELCKLIENTYRDVNIALSNEVANVAEGLGVDAREAITLANMHPRVHLLMPGIGVGGHCVPIDPWFIKEVDPANSRLIQTARDINDQRPTQVAAKIRRAVSDLQRPEIILLGMTYKADTYDTRESPALVVAEQLRADGYAIEQYDPMVTKTDRRELAEICRGKDLAVVLVPHRAMVADLDAHEAEVLAAMRTPRLLRFA